MKKESQIVDQYGEPWTSERLVEEPFAAESFLEQIEETSYGFTNHWRECHMDEIKSEALRCFDELEQNVYIAYVAQARRCIN